MELSASKEKYTYFQPGEMVFLISHQSDHLIDAPIAHLIDWSNEQAERLNLTVSRCQERELRFPGTLELAKSTKQERTLLSGMKYDSPQPRPRGAFSLIPVQVRGEADPKTNPDGCVDTSELVELIIRLDDARKDNSLVKAGITLDVVSPNWLASPCKTEYGGGGGHPPPVPYTGAIDTAAYSFPLPPAIASLCPQEEVGRGVTVAILDTAPCLHDLTAAYKRHHKVLPHNPKDHHPVLEGLLGPKGRLHVHTTSLDELLRMRGVHLRDHQYQMTDHGLFVAGIVNSLAPSAEIHLYEVLNPQGAGDLQSVARGLWKVIDDQKGQETRLVVNCSLVINVPRLNHRITDLDPRILAKIVRQWEKHKDDPIEYLTSEFLSTAGESWLARQGLAIEWICDLIYALGSRVIAAARNDWDNQEPRADTPQVRYPAAFDSSLGVGILPKGEIAIQTTSKRAAGSYPNLSDQPESIGIMTLGGDAEEKPGVRGVYIGNFPLSSDAEGTKAAAQENKSDWAWWTGTSFATPILTGAIAAVLSSLAKPATTEDAIVRICTAVAIEENKTLHEEDMLKVP